MDPLSNPGRPPRPVPVFAPDPSDFEATVRKQLGDLGTGSDGFDALFAVPAAAIDVDTASLATFDEDIAAAAFNAGDFASVYHAPVDAELPGFLADGEALNAAVQNPAPADGTVTITTPPSPPDTNGGGGGPEVGPGNSGGGYIFDPCFGDPFCHSTDNIGG